MNVDIRSLMMVLLLSGRWVGMLLRARAGEKALPPTLIIQIWCGNRPRQRWNITLTCIVDDCEHRYALYYLLSLSGVAAAVRRRSTLRPLRIRSRRDRNCSTMKID